MKLNIVANRLGVSVKQLLMLTLTILLLQTLAPAAIATDTSSAAPSNTRPKVALALGGGGTRGAAHVGVLRVLEQEGIPIDMVAGTSMGSIVGGFYCAGISVRDIEAKFETSTMI